MSLSKNPAYTEYVADTPDFFPRILPRKNDQR